MTFLQPGSILSLHRKAVQALIGSGNGDAALLYLCLLDDQDGGALHWDSARLEGARQALVSLQLLEEDTPVAPAPEPKLEDTEPPDYSTRDITMALENNEGFKTLRPEVERRLGKALSPADLKGLYFIYDYLGLPPEVVLLLVSWCIQQKEEEGHPGRKPTVPQLKKEAARWQKEGVRDLDSAEQYITRRARLNGRGREIMRLLDMGDRLPVPREEEYLDDWSQLPFQDEVLRRAYEETVFYTNKFTWKYMDRILKRWNKAGVHTLAALEDWEKNPKNRPAPKGKGKAAKAPRAPTPESIPKEVFASPEDIQRMIAAASWKPKKEDPHGIQ